MDNKKITVRDMDRFSLTILKNRKEVEVHGYLLNYERGAQAKEDGYHRYGIRHSDYDDSCPSTLEPNVTVNWYGDFFCEEEISFDEIDCITIVDWNYE